MPSPDIQLCRQAHWKKKTPPFSKASTLSAILSSEKETLTYYLSQAKRRFGKFPHHLRVDWFKARDAWPLCRCDECIGPCLELARKEKIFSQKVTKAMIKKHLQNKI